MIYLHPKRWCEDCKGMVFAAGHQHGLRSQSVDAKVPDTRTVCEAADVNRAFTDAREHIVKAKEIADKESQRILHDRLKSAVGSLDDK